jgi:signal transduction histidine kinase
LLIVWQDADTLQDALDQVMSSNRALQASEELLARHADELAESRARVVAATDRERRRIERDLHDGAQQRLDALAVNLLVARQQSEAEPAASVTITVTGSGHGLEFEILDTGVGFDTTETGRGSGLVNMADRLAVAGGTLAIESRPQCGTRIIGRIPIPAQDITHDASSR